MQHPKARILSTRPLEAALLEQAAGRDILIDTLSFITMEPVRDEALHRRIHDLSRRALVAVFTSMNAVDAVVSQLRTQPERLTGETNAFPAPLALPWQIFCIGYATQQLVRENFGDHCITGTAPSAAALADTILRQGKGKTGRPADPIREVYFFCGDQRRDELGEKLQGQSIRVNELIVYKTIGTPHKVEQAYDGIVFFSPSAVHSFFLVNSVPAGTLLFAIGRTTADTIRSYTANPTILSGSPEKEALIRQVIDYYNKQ